MDLNVMVWAIGLCLAIQRHRGDHLLSLGAESSGQGAEQSTFTKDENEQQFFCLREQALEELGVQQVFAALALDFEKMETPSMFSRVFSSDQLLPLMDSSSRTHGDGKVPHSTAATDTGGMMDVPSIE